MINSTLNITVQLQLEGAKKELMSLKALFEKSADSTKAIKDTSKDTAVSAEDQFKALYKQGQWLDKIRKTLGTNSELYKSQAAEMQKLGKGIEMSASQMRTLEHRTKCFDMTFLSLLFSGMWLERTFGGFFDSMVDHYKQITGMNTQFTKGLTKVSASFGYLKFAMVNALNSPIVIAALEKITSMFTWLGDYFIENPELATTILTISKALGVIGTFAMTAGGLMQLKNLINIMSTTSAAQAVTNLKDLVAVGSISLGLFLVYDGLSKTIKNWDDFGWLEIAEVTGGAMLLALGAKHFIPNIPFSYVGSAIAVGALVAGILISIKLIKDGSAKIDDGLKEEFGWERVKKIMGGALEATLGTAFTMAAAGATIGSMITPGAGTAVGALAGLAIGTIIGGISVLIKLIPELKWVSMKELSKNLNILFTPGYKERLEYDAEMDIRREQTRALIEENKAKAKQVKESLLKLNTAMKDQVTPHMTVFGNTFEDTINPEMDLFTSLISKSNTNLLPKHTTYINDLEGKYKNLAREINSAAAAQERLNRAESRKTSLFGTSLSTTTRSDR